VAVALGLAHVVAVGARQQLPVDAAPLVARRIGAVFGEFDAGAALAPGVDAVAQSRQHVADDEVEVGGVREQRRLASMY
jgi:hypothetical protein